MSELLVERVAWAFDTDDVRAAIFIQNLADRGHVIVPREPTEEMLGAGVDAPCSFAYRYDEAERKTAHCLVPGEIWRAMIDAALGKE